MVTKWLWRETFTSEAAVIEDNHGLLYFLWHCRRLPIYSSQNIFLLSELICILLYRWQAGLLLQKLIIFSKGVWAPWLNNGCAFGPHLRILLYTSTPLSRLACVYKRSVSIRSFVIRWHSVQFCYSLLYWSGSCELACHRKWLYMESNLCYAGTLIVWVHGDNVDELIFMLNCLQNYSMVLFFLVFLRVCHTYRLQRWRH